MRINGTSPREDQVMNAEIVYNIQSGPFWDWRVAFDLFLGGAGLQALDALGCGAC